MAKNQRSPCNSLSQLQKTLVKSDKCSICNMQSWRQCPCSFRTRMLAWVHFCTLRHMRLHCIVLCVVSYILISALAVCLLHNMAHYQELPCLITHMLSAICTVWNILLAGVFACYFFQATHATCKMSFSHFRYAGDALRISIVSIYRSDEPCWINKELKI